MIDYRTGVLLAVLACSFGCGGSDDTKPVYEVTGKVTLDGEPFGPTSIMLVDHSEEKPKSVHGQVDQEGNVTFTTYDVGDGAPEGTYSVVIGMDFGAPPKPFPNIYRDADNSPLTVEVKPEDGTEIVMDMDSKIGGRMYRGPSFGKDDGPDMSAANEGIRLGTEED